MKYLVRKSDLNVIKPLYITNSFQEKTGKEGHIKWHHEDTASKTQYVNNYSGKKPGFFNDKLCMCVCVLGGQVGRDRGRKNTIGWDVRRVSCNTWILIWTNNEKYETIREVWLLTGYLLVLQNYFSVFIYVNGHVIKEPLSFKGAVGNIYRLKYLQMRLCDVWDLP